MVDGVGGFQGGDDALGLAEELKAFKGFLVGHRHILGAATVLEIAVLGTDTGVIQTRRDAVRLPDLAVLVLKDVGLGAVENAHRSRHQGGGVLAAFDAPARRLDAD
ncbi:hypothetical protein ES708_29038 [subsurface metagenome]